MTFRKGFQACFTDYARLIISGQSEFVPVSLVEDVPSISADIFNPFAMFGLKSNPICKFAMVTAVLSMISLLFSQ